MASSFKGVEQNLEQLLASGKDAKTSVKTVLGNIEAPKQAEEALLFHAAKRGHDSVLKALLARDLHANPKDDKDRTPLSYAAEYGHEGVVAALLKRKDVDATVADKLRRTPLSYAAGYGHKANVKALLEKNQAQANVTDIYGMPPLYYASVGSRNDALPTLMKYTTPQPSSEVKAGWTLDHQQHSAQRRITAEPSHVLKGHPRSVISSVCFAWNGSYVALGSDRVVDVFESASGTSMRTFTMPPEKDGPKNNFVRALTSIPSHPWLAGGSDDGTIQVWDVIKGARVLHFLAHRGPIRALKCSRNGTDLVSGGEDKYVRNWDAKTGKLLHSYTAAHGITSLAISPTGKFVAAGTSANTAMVWDMATQQLVAELGQVSKHHHYISSLTFFPNDDYHLSTSSNDKVVRKYEIARNPDSTTKKASCLFNAEGHKGAVWNVAVARGGDWVITSSQDRSLRIWRGDSGELQLVLYGHGGQVPLVAVSPTQDLFISIGDRGVAKLWRLKRIE